MGAADFNADVLIDRIDSGSLMPAKHAVIRAMLSKIPVPRPLQEELLTGLTGSVSVEREQWLDRLWTEIQSLPANQQGGLRLSVGLLHPDGALNAHEAEYYVAWGREQGLVDGEIAEAFGVEA